MQSKAIELVTSRKFLISLVAVVVICLLAAAGKVGGDQAMDFVKWVLGAWLASQAATDVANKLKEATSVSMRSTPSEFMQGDGRSDGTPQ